MLTCTCKEQFPSIKQLLAHIRTRCRIGNQSNVYMCGEIKCLRHFTILDSFRRHLKLKHGSLEENITKKQDKLVRELKGNLSSPDSVTNGDLHQDQFLLQKEIIQEEIPSEKNCYLISDAARFVASLHGNQMVPRSTVQAVVKGVHDLQKNLATNLKDNFNRNIPQMAQKEDVKVVFNETLSLLEQCMEPFLTEYKRLKYFSTSGSYIAPKEVILGYRKDTRQIHNQHTLQCVPCTMSFVPLRYVLQSFFSIDGILHEVLNHLQQLDTSMKASNKNNQGAMFTDGIQNIMQGTVWQQRYKIGIDVENDLSVLCLPLVVFYDDFEVSNPLGSHAGIHKLGGVYVSLPALPVKWFSLLQHTLIMALFHSSDRLKFGNKIIFQDIINELNFLQNVGVTVNTAVFTGVLKFPVAALVGDNLGLNQILGFTECFVANYFCRVCFANKPTTQEIGFENPELLRNTESYDQNVELNDVSKTGIKERCCLLKLDNFDLFNHVGMDPMHDLFEGVARYIMGFVVSYLIEKKILTLETLENQLFSFNFGPDSGSKPVLCLKKEGAHVKIKTSAIEMLTLVRYFGLMVGCYVPESDEVWQLYIIFRRVVERLLNHTVFKDTTEQLRYLINELNQTYRTVTGLTLKPKFHFLIHYPEMLYKFGPLRHIWTMRFEAKHKVAKMAGRTSCSRINICKTIAIKNQLVLNNFLLNKTLPPSFLCSKKIPLQVEIGENLNVTTTHSVEWVSVDSVKWIIGNVVCIDICSESGFPQFGTIKSIHLSLNNDIYFSLTLFNTLVFNDHFYAWMVERTDINCFTQLSKLIAPYPNTLTLLSNHSLYVTLRWQID